MKIYNSTQNDGKHIFVFGSNLAGIHGAGAALQAKAVWGAVQGVEEGRTGNAYAIPTKDKHFRTLHLEYVQVSVWHFLQYARDNPDLTFLVTRIGCGLAGYADAEIAPMFAEAPFNCQLPDGWEVRRGFRSFGCDCGHEWDTLCCDHRSPRIENCPNCDAEVSPCDSWSDATLKCDDSGNLI